MQNVAKAIAVLLCSTVSVIVLGILQLICLEYVAVYCCLLKQVSRQLLLAVRIHTVDSTTGIARRRVSKHTCVDFVLQELQFAVGRYCCARLQMYHALIHYKHRLRGKLKKHIKHAYNMQKVTCHHMHGWRHMLAFVVIKIMCHFWVLLFSSILTDNIGCRDV